MKPIYRQVERTSEFRIRGEMSYDGDNFYAFEARIDLFRIDVACENPVAAARIWNLQDGYGEPGFTPAQGWDWSGIRDSTPEAIEQMDAVASEFVSNADLSALLAISI